MREVHIRKDDLRVARVVDVASVPLAEGAARLRLDLELGAAMQRDLRAFYPVSRAFVAARRVAGIEGILESWARLAAGTTVPREGLVLSFI
jgi:hypothetical protein